MNIRIIKKEFKRIKSLRFIKSKRHDNTGLVKTFEYYFGLKEDYTKDSYFEGYVIKSQIFLSSSKIILFTKSPTHPERANQYLSEKYGVFDKKFKKIKTLYTSLFCNGFNNYLDKYSFKLDIDKTRKKLYFIVKNLSDNKIVKEDIYYTYEDIIENSKKLDKLLVVTAKTKINRGNRFFHYQSGTLFFGFKLKKFLNLIKSGRAECRIRISVDRSGPNKGKPHDHGSGFIIHKDYLKDLYENVYEIK